MLGRFLYILLVLSVALPVQAASPYGRFHALVIGIKDYQHLTPLKTPIADAKAVGKLLKEQYGFTVELVLNPDRDRLVEAIYKLRSTMTEEEDSLLIYYAGHGALDKTTGVDYWQPVNAQRHSDLYWVPTSRVTDTLRAIGAKHVLVVADSCYSGSLLRDSGAKLAAGMSRDKFLQRMFQRRSRTALTSGGEEPVLDSDGSGHSVFAWVFLEILRKNQDVLEGDTLFDRIKRPVALKADQTPLYGDIRKAGQDVEQGDFVFVPKALQGQKEPPVVAQTERRGGDNFARRGDNGQLVGQRTERTESVRPPVIGQYIDHGDGTVTDTKTGLMWKRCSEGLSGDNCEDGEIERYNWDDAMQRFKNVSYAGYADWRLPTIDELKTLVQCSKGVRGKRSGWCNKGSEMPTINEPAFPNTPVWFYWSGSPSAGNSLSAWGVGFSYGSSGYNYRHYFNVVRLVRGGQ